MEGDSAHRNALNPFELNRRVEERLRAILHRALHSSRPTDSLHCALDAGKNTPDPVSFTFESEGPYAGRTHENKRGTMVGFGMGGKALWQEGTVGGERFRKWTQLEASRLSARMLNAKSGSEKYSMLLSIIVPTYSRYEELVHCTIEIGYIVCWF